MGRERSGRKPKPTALRLLQGNPGKQPFNKKEPKPKKPTDVPKPPLILKGHKVARKEWNRVAPILYNIGLFTDLEIPALANYCLLWERYVEVTQKIEEIRKEYSNWVNAGGEKDPEKDGVKNDHLTVISPKGYIQQNALLGIQHTVAREMRACMIEFGMTPSSRSRMNIEPPPKESKLDQIRNKKKVS